MVTEYVFKWPFDYDAKITCGYKENKDVWFTHDTLTGLWLPVKDGFGNGQNPGLDYSVPEGTPILAMAPGMIVRSGWENIKERRYGFGMRIRQLVSMPGYDNWTLVYGHLSEAIGRIGDKVDVGDRIGFSGATGATEKPLFHVELLDVRGQYQEIRFV